MPPHIEYRLTLALNVNYVDVRRAARPVRRAVARAPTASIMRSASRKPSSTITSATSPTATISTAIRVGIQPFSFDFRGFLFQDQQLGVRLFGNRDNNRFQYNLAAIWRLEKDTNSRPQQHPPDAAQRLDPPRQPLPPGFPVRRPDQPGEPHLEHQPRARRDRGRRQRLPGPPGADRQSARAQLRRRLSRLQRRRPDRPDQPHRLGLRRCSAGTGTTSSPARPAKIRSFFLAAEPSYDFNWIRLRGAALFASGDGDPFDDVEGGFDAIFENPIFAGADTSYWIRQTIPFAGGGRAVSHQRPQRHPQLAALVQGAGPVQLQQSRHDAARRRRRFRPHARNCACRPTSTISGSTRPRCCRRCATRARSAATSAGTSRRRRSGGRKFTQNIVFRAVRRALLQPGTGFRDLFDEQSTATGAIIPSCSTRS